MKRGFVLATTIFVTAVAMFLLWQYVHEKIFATILLGVVLVSGWVVDYLTSLSKDQENNE